MSVRHLLERAVNLARSRPISPMAVLAELGKLDVGSPDEHRDAYLIVQEHLPVRDVGLVRWWEKEKPTQEMVVQLFEDALSEASLRGM